MEDKVRLTVDMTKDDHLMLKSFCVKNEMSMKDFLLACAFKEMEEMEDRLLEKEARRVLEEIACGRDEVVSFERIKRRLSK